MRRAPYLTSVALAATLATTASATVTEPNGLVVPLDSQNGETQLYTLFAGRGESFDWRNDAHDAPATFSPLCDDFTAEYILNEAGSHFGLAWYNAPASSPPTGGDLHLIVPQNSAVGFKFTGASIKSDPAYAGGEIGFALVGGQTHYSEYQWNPTCSGCGAPGPWKLAVIYASTTTQNAYYLAFEDGDVNGSSFKNDGDFNDDVFFLTGLAGCAGAGESCDTGQPGICGPGVTKCSAGNGVTCVGIQPPGTESCNGLDDDCNGSTDDGDLCPPDQICDKGTCVHKCGGGELACPLGKVCDTSGYCVDIACQSVTCPSGQVCVAGTCAAPCDGVVCPQPTVCLAGQCLDPCASVTCDAASVCVSGVCLPKCDCLTCPSGQSCDTASGRCMESACANQPACAAGTVCAGGSCVDPCASAQCPAGQACTGGACVDAPDAGAAGAGGSFFDGGFGGFGGNGGGSAGAGADTTDGGATDGAVSSHRAGPASGESGGCGCRTAGTSRGPLGFAALALGALVATRRRRR